MEQEIVDKSWKNKLKQISQNVGLGANMLRDIFEMIVPSLTEYPFFHCLVPVIPLPHTSSPAIPLFPMPQAHASSPAHAQAHASSPLFPNIWALWAPWAHEGNNPSMGLWAPWAHEGNNPSMGP